MASPEEVLAAAVEAPNVFHIAKYYRPIRLMREKGHSWRDLSEWLKQFNIDVSFAHLRRLFIAEDERLSRLEAQQLHDRGMHPDDIRQRLEEYDPLNRLPAADPGDAEEEGDS